MNVDSTSAASSTRPALLVISPLLRPRDADFCGTCPEKRRRTLRRAVHAGHGDHAIYQTRDARAGRSPYPRRLRCADGKGFLFRGREVEIIRLAKVSKSKNKSSTPGGDHPAVKRGR